MVVNNNANIVLIDIDDTLVSLHYIEGITPIYVEFHDEQIPVYPRAENIQFVKDCALRGFYLRVHSQGGHEWAERVVRLLGLEKMIHSVETKPKWYLDDLDANAWMDRVYKCKQE